jgi:hypothetical protein
MSEKTKLSELIREGAKLRPQGFGDYFTSNDDLENCSCALGAALEILTGTYGYDAHNHPSLAGKLGEFLAVNAGIDATVSHPYLDWQQTSIFKAVVILNDELKWTRERIADWLEAQGF